MLVDLQRMDNVESALLRAPLFTRIDDPWIGLVVLGGFILISSILAMIVLCCLWRRHQKRSQLESESYMLGNAPNGRRPEPDQMSGMPDAMNANNGNSQVGSSSNERILSIIFLQSRNRISSISPMAETGFWMKFALVSIRKMV